MLITIYWGGLSPGTGQFHITTAGIGNAVVDNIILGFSVYHGSSIQQWIQIFIVETKTVNRSKLKYSGDPKTPFVNSWIKANPVFGQNKIRLLLSPKDWLLVLKIPTKNISVHSKPQLPSANRLEPEPPMRIFRINTGFSRNPDPPIYDYLQFGS